MFINNLFVGELEPNATVGGCISIYEKAWPEPDNTILRIENEASNIESGVGWGRAATIGDGHRQQARTNLAMTITNSAEGVNNQAMQDIHNQFFFLLLATTIPYARRFRMNESFFHEPYQALKYRKGEGYKDHYDGGTDIGRAISAVVYLNEEYQGGHIEFPNFNVKLKPEKGMLILFPSNYAYRHIAHEIEEGVKYSLVTWVHDRPL
jgi:predicted 2-oxoglutarate/Fe(II)-dependent dioxygenase YbiX